MIGAQATGTVRKIRSIEGLRGLLALWVLFGHTLAAAGLGEDWRGPFRILATGGYAVEVFIAVSGFVIFYLLDGARESYGRFLVRRFLRLYPVYFVCLIASVLILRLDLQAYTDAPFSHPLNDHRIEIAQHSLDFLPQQLLAHIFMVQSLIPDFLLPNSNYAILGQAWSLSLEWQFYVLAPLLFVFLARGGRAALAVIVLVCAAHFLFTGNEGFLPRHLPFFALGTGSYFLWRLPWRPSSPLLAPVVVALAYLLTAGPGIVIWSAVFMAAYQREAIGATWVNPVLEHPISLAVGRISYSIYLSHGMVLAGSMLCLERMNASAFGRWPFFVLLFPVTLSGTLALSWALYQWIEAPFIALGKRQGRALRPTPQTVP